MMMPKKKKDLFITESLRLEWAKGKLDNQSPEHKNINSRAHITQLNSDRSYLHDQTALKLKGASGQEK